MTLDNQNPFKVKFGHIINMSPSDPHGLPDDSFHASSPGMTLRRNAGFPILFNIYL